jgi:hypothetical protein
MGCLKKSKGIEPVQINGRLIEAPCSNIVWCFQLEADSLHCFVQDVLFVDVCVLVLPESLMNIIPRLATGNAIVCILVGWATGSAG